MPPRPLTLASHARTLHPPARPPVFALLGTEGYPEWRKLTSRIRRVVEPLFLRFDPGKAIRKRPHVLRLLGDQTEFHGCALWKFNRRKG